MPDSLERLFVALLSFKKTNKAGAAILTERHRLTDARVRADVVSDKTVWRTVTLSTDSGLSGVGEASLEGTDEVFHRRLQQAAGSLVGKALPMTGSRSGNQSPCDLPTRTIRSAIDQALCDLWAQIAGQSLSDFLGAASPSPRIPLYANINRATRNRSAEGFAANARAASAEGYRAIKLAPFDNLTPEACDTDEGRGCIVAGLKRIRDVANAVPDCEVMVDCHWRFSLAAAEQLIDALAETGVVWLECPLPERPDRIVDLKSLRARANRKGMRLCGLETFGGWDKVGSFVLGGAYDVVMPDVKHAGSLSTIIDLAAKTQAAGTVVSLHNPSGPVAHLHSAHAMAALGTAERLEVQWNESPMFFTLTDPPPVLDDGFCAPGRSPGLGACLIAEPSPAGVDP